MRIFLALTITLHRCLASKRRFVANSRATGPRLCNPANPLLSTHIARGWVVRAGVIVRAGRQQDLRHLRMPTDRRLVKWGDLVLRGDRSGKEDVDKDKNERKKGYGCWSRNKDTYYNITLEARAATQHANTQGLCACLGVGGYMGPGPFYSHPTPHVRGPVSVIQPTLPSTNIDRGMDV